MKHTLLVELFTEELPPKALPRLAASFAGAIVASLIEKKLVAADAQPTIFASPRRLGVSIPAVLAVAADEEAINWLELTCPICGASAAMGLIAPSGKKNLICSHCHTVWVYMRTACGLCGHTEERGTVFYTADEERKVLRILKELDLASESSIVLIDARADNKPSGSKA